jgi:hypothetical protein
MLSADGRRLLLERGRQYSVLDLATGRWSVFSARLVRLDPPPDNGLAGQRVAVGPARSSSAGLVAQAWGPGGLALPLPDPARGEAGPPYLTVMGGTPKVLAFVTDLDRPRALDAPTVAGWLDHDTVVYETRAPGQELLIAWDGGTRRFARVATIAGSATSSFALVGAG